MTQMTKLLLAAVPLIAFQASAMAQDADKIAAMQKAYREAAQPGPEHQMFARMAGTWDLQIRMFSKEGSGPTILPAIAENTLLLGGRFLESRAKAPGSDTLTAVNLMSFDRRAGEFHSMGMDVSGTYWVTARGPRPADGQPIVMSGTDHDPKFDYTQVYDFILEWVDDDTYTWSIVFKDSAHTGGGGPFKMVEITYTRRK